MSAKKKYRNISEYLKYLKGEFSNKERHSFERDLQADPFELDAMEGMDRVTAHEFEEDILSLHATLRKRLQRRRRRAFYYAAASIASLLIVGTIFLNIYNINPKTAAETIPKDETFLHEDLAQPDEEAVPDEVSRQVEAPIADERTNVQANTPAPEETRARVVEEAMDETRELDESEIVYEEVQDPDAIITREDKAIQAEEGMPDDLPDRALLIEEAEAPAPAVVAPAEKAAAPVRETDELVVMEAQPGRSQKKGRASEAMVPGATGRVSGIVVSSEDMEPLPGASIIVKGTDSGQVADGEGRFSLVADQREQMTVIASYVGMETVEYQLSGGGENRVVMQPDMATLDEVVVIGYEADKSVVPTGAVQMETNDKADVTYSGAEPEGGLEAFKKYMEEQIRFPAGDTTSMRELVVMRFNVDAGGTISRIESLRSPGQPFTEEAIRLLMNGPAWKPARNENGPTDDVVRMRIVFKKQ